MAFLTHNEIEKMGFLSIGENLQISDRASFYGVGRIAIGNNVRIDDYCVLSAGLGGITIGNYVHIAVFSSLIGASTILLSDFCNVSSRVSIYSSNDDYSGASLTNSTVPDAYKKIQSSEVIIKKHVIIGCGSVILPGAILHEGVAIGALSLVKNKCEAFGIYAGIPASLIKKRKPDLLAIEQDLVAKNSEKYKV
jgi:acetyltransferase-like isoleucine patch superfamily enzyme